MDAFVVGKGLSRKRLPPSRLFDELTNRKLRKKIKKKNQCIATNIVNILL